VVCNRPARVSRAARDVNGMRIMFWGWWTDEE
jgi:hypothetical protein